MQHEGADGVVEVVRNDEADRRREDERDQMERIDTRQSQQQEANVAAAIDAEIELASVRVREDEAAQDEEEIDRQVLVTDDAFATTPFQTRRQRMRERVGERDVREDDPERRVAAQSGQSTDGPRARESLQRQAPLSAPRSTQPVPSWTARRT